VPSVTAPSLPRVFTLPDSVSSSGREAVELAASVGLHLDPWQQLALEHGLGESAGGKWSAFEVALIVGRQNGKGSILEARELAGLFLFDEQLILHSAHQFKTAAEGFRRILTLVENTDWMRKRIKTVTRSHGDEGIELTNGQRLRFVARSRTSGRGFTGDCLILDEAFNLDSDDMAALLPTLGARPNPQIWYASSAGMSTSSQLAAVRERGLAGGDGSLCYMEWSADPGASLDDPAAWAAANPALGIRISAEHVARERAALPDVEFARERLGIWAPSGGNDVINQASWLACSDPDSVPLDPVVFAVDVGPDAASAAISVAGMTAEGFTHVETVATGSGMGWVADKLTGLAEKWTPAGIVIDAKSAGAALVDQLADAFTVIVTNADQLADACAMFQTAAHEGSLRHRGEPSLNLALANARRRPLGERWAWSRKGSSHDITPLVAATLAAYGLHEIEPNNYSVADSIY